MKSVLLYGCETWKAMPNVLGKVQTFIKRCLRKFWNSSDKRKLGMRNYEKRQRSLEKEIGQHGWCWFGHTLRKPGNIINRHALQWNPQGTRSRGRSRETWKSCADKELLKIEHTWGELPQIVQDRQRWKSLVRGLYPDRGGGLWWWYYRHRPVTNVSYWCLGD